jgi:hypothetical protein
MAAEFGDNFFDYLRLHANQDDVSVFGGLQIIRPYRYAQFCAQRAGAFLVGDCRRRQFWRKEAILQQGLKQNTSHLARTEHRDFLARKIVSHPLFSPFRHYHRPLQSAVAATSEL